MNTVNIIEPFVLAGQGRELEGKIRQADLPRLLSLLFHSDLRDNKTLNASEPSEIPEGSRDVDYLLQFRLDDGGMPMVTGRIQTDVSLQCQRCMQEMVFPISIKVHLGIAASFEAIEKLPESCEPLVVSGAEMTLSGLIEDELILALPAIAMHEREDCPEGQSFLEVAEDDQPEEASRKNPFAMLSELKVEKTD